MACSDYQDPIEAITQVNPVDAALCPWDASVGLVVFSTLVVMGVINIPIYLRQDSAVTPVMLTLIISGLVLSFTASMAQGIVAAALLLVLGIGPVLVLRRLRR